MNWQPDQRYRVDGLDRIDSPALLVFPEVIESNIDRALALTATDNGHCLQPHIKTVKNPDIARMAIARGITRFKCSTVSEGELLGSVGAGKVLLSYQLSAVKARRWQALRALYPDTEFAALIDNADSARVASELFAENPLPVYIDINPGMDRTGIPPEKAPELIDRILELPGLVLRGFHLYDGHIRDAEEAGRKRQAEAALAEVAALRRSAGEKTAERLEIVVAGSPNFPFYVGYPDVWVSPGTFFLWDAGYGVSFSNWGFEPAALVLTRVLSVIDDEKLCFDMGSKAVSPDKEQPRMAFPGLPDAEVVGQWEEHLVVRVPNTAGIAVGDPYLAIPAHVCTTVNLYQELLPVVEGRVSGSWPVVARDRRITV
ncbi:D-serine deaminase-like pyridoxal phosphate-dependent protein [Neolewinella xylanilytica]|uniref:D-serine deaminase-like pyridoxal phosphate-dependent protein n=1 Tax=Neolewinella xylanilytica TaxID=1514080 RepID=A0A2S6IB61_9BACT|nr:alanine racemase [Neolewinella xylanilytica]PPK88702.1 D-serine deaminase-like pyridoxal phosphate-dependent protein [Neolewinella xylanilytica]